MMKTEKTDRIGIRLIAVGMIFLFNPTINIIDILPDFIGLFMIVRGLDRMADMEEHFAISKKSFGSLAIVSAIKLLACALLPFTDEVFTLVLAFSFSVIEAIFFIPAVINMFEGFNYFGMRESYNSVYRVPSGKALRGDAKGKYGSAEALRNFTITAFIVRLAAAVLPVVPVLFMYESRGYVGGSFNWENYKNVWYVLACIVVLATGIPWLVKMTHYLKGITADKTLVDHFTEIYSKKILPRKGYFAEKEANAVSVLILLGTVFCFDLYLDYVNWLPNAIAAGFFTTAMVLMRKNTKYSLPGIVLCILWAVPSALSVYFQTVYISNNYTPMSYVNGIGEAMDQYTMIMACGIAEAVLMAAALIMLILCVRDTIKVHCILFEESLPELRLGMGKPLERKICVAFIPVIVLFAIITALVGIYPFACIYFPEVRFINIVSVIAIILFYIRDFGIAQNELYDKLNIEY